MFLTTHKANSQLSRLQVQHSDYSMAPDPGTNTFIWPNGRGRWQLPGALSLPVTPSIGEDWRCCKETGGGRPFGAGCVFGPACQVGSPHLPIAEYPASSGFRVPEFRVTRAQGHELRETQPQLETQGSHGGRPVCPRSGQHSGRSPHRLCTSRRASHALCHLVHRYPHALGRPDRRDS